MLQSVHRYTPVTQPHRGFTIVEISVVLFIIGLLTVIGSVSYSAMQKNARDTEAKEQLANFGRVLVKYKADHGAYPSSMDGLPTTYEVKFSTDLFSTDAYYNLIYCSQDPYGSYALTAITKAGQRIYIKNGDTPAQYSGALTWQGSDHAGICGSVLPGSTSTGPAGWRESGESPAGWRSWVNGA